MIDSAAAFVLQILSVIDTFSVCLIIGSVTILVLLEVTRSAHEALDRGSVVARKVLSAGLMTQLVYRGVDLVTTSNLVLNKDIAASDLSPVYLLSLVLTLGAVITYVFYRFKKVSFQLSVFIEAALWYTVFILGQVASQSASLQTTSAGSLTLITLIVVILIILMLDSLKRYYHVSLAKKSKK